MTEVTESAARHRPRLRPRFAKLLLIFSGILMALLIAEVALRISGFKYFNPYIVDQDVGYSLRPGAEGWWKREGLTYVRINSHGFRDREHEMAKPPDTLRIAVLGDSYAEAFQVPQEKAFWSVMERKLQECPQLGRPKVEVLNFGISGFSTARELILLREQVWRYSPDVIVLLVTIGNDVRDNSRALNKYSGQPLPYFVFQDGKLILDDSLLAARNRSVTFRLQRSFIGKGFNWVRNHLRLLGLIYRVREAYQSSSQISAQPSDGQKQQDRSPESSGEPGLNSEVFRAPANSEWDDAWRVTEALIVQMRDEVRRKGAKFLVVTGSSGIQVNPDPAVRQEFMNRLNIRNLFYSEQRIKALGEYEGFDVLNLAPPLEEYASRNKVFLHGVGDAKGKGHWNEIGHRLAGELIAQELCRD
jgi:hypothetical protein